MTSSIDEARVAEWLRPVVVEEDEERSKQLQSATLAVSGDIEGHEIEATLAAHGAVDNEVRVWIGRHLKDEISDIDLDRSDELISHISGAASVHKASVDQSDTSVLLGFGFQSARFLGLTPVSPEMTEIMAARIREISELKRSRPSIDSLQIPTPKLSPARKSEEGEAVTSQVYEDISVQNQALRKLASGTNAVLEEFRTWFLTQDEESEILWWVIGGRSDDGERLAKMDRPERAAVAARELMARTRLIPGPATIAHLIGKLFEKGTGSKLELSMFAHSCQALGLPCDEGTKGSRLMPILTSQIVLAEHDSPGDSETWKKVADNKFKLDVTKKYDAEALAQQLYLELQMSEVIARRNDD